ncbi:MFS transporter [Luteimonas sp. RD2P54]|uniref:MFS transporter n=1 Tax=Luteimonas endophytica TaxID=3042023 RepID=A0ABT6JD89_9GAMM|nr:MFS transporter [Luteimonas endophytica]MDH5824602.1 MFS transporter [Luteimonas endophytica]
MSDAAAVAAPAAGRGRALALMALALVLAMSPWFSASAVVVQLRAQWGFGASLAAWITIAVQLGFVLGALGSALLGLADRVSAPRLIAIAACGAATANALVLLAQSPLQLLLARVATGACLAAVYPPAMKLMATWFVRGRGLALGVLIGAITVGSALPHLVNALGGARWQGVIGWTTALTLAGAAVVAFGVREGPYPFPRAPFRLGEVTAILRNRGVVLASLGYLGHMWELYAMWAWFSTFALTATAVAGDPGRASLLAFAAIAAGLPGCVLAGAAADRFGRARTAAAAMAVSGACCIAAGWAHAGPGWLLVAVALVWGISVIADSAQFSALVTEHGDQRSIGTALTLQLALGFALTVATIWIVPLLAAALGSWRWVFLVLVPGPLLGIAAMLALQRSGRLAAAPGSAG